MSSRLSLPARAASAALPALPARAARAALPALSARAARPARGWHAARPARAALALCAVGALTAACSVPSFAPRSAPSNEITELPSSNAPGSRGNARESAPIAGPPLPAGSYYSPAGSFAPTRTSDAKVRGSYRPDDKTPQERVPDIIARGELIVGIDQSNNLLSYREATTGELRGFEVDLAHEIARDIFGDPNKVKFRYLESAERVDALTSGTVDLVIRTMTINAERQQSVEFSIPYMTTNTRMLVMTSSGIRDLSDTSGRTVCAAVGSTAVNKTRLNAPNANLLITRAWGDCLMALQVGQADAIIVDDTLLSGMLDQDPYTSIVGDPIDVEQYGVGIRKPDAQHDSRGLIRQVNSTIERIRRDGTWLEMFNQWFGDYLPVPSLPAPNYRDEEEDAQ